MGARTTYPPGTFSWVDLSTSDPVAAQAFYGKLFGWEFVDVPVGAGRVYVMAKRRVEGASDGNSLKSVAAIFNLDQQQAEQGIPPHWQSYITVDDVEAMAQRVPKLGGRVLCPPMDVMNAGRMCGIADPSGAFVQLWQAKDSIGAEWVNDPGCFCWNELNTRDVPKAKTFWEALMGWKFQPEPDNYYVIKNGGRDNGGMLDMTGKVPEAVPPHWNVSFHVTDLTGSLKIVAESAGEVILPPVSIGPGKIAVIRDPQGATLSLYGDGPVDD